MATKQAKKFTQYSVTKGNPSPEPPPQENISFELLTADTAEETEDEGEEENEEKEEDDEVGKEQNDGEEEEEEEPQKPSTEIPIDNINLCFVGGVSTGKSTILNAIFCEQLTQCKIKRTTMVPTVYVENDNDYPHITPPATIFHTIEQKNDELIQKSEGYSSLNMGNAADYRELMFNVGKLDINILEKSYVNVYDIPGLNDARTKDIYYQYLQDNFEKFNLVILLVDIHSGLNTSDEIDIVNFITKNTVVQKETHQKKIYTLAVVNKADDMQLVEEDGDDLEMTGEMREMYEQSDTLIRKMFHERNVSDQLVGVIPLCAIDAYLYRMVQKHGSRFKLTPEQILKIGVNDEGKKFSKLKPATQEKKVNTILSNQTFIHDMIKLSGFRRFETMLHEFLHKNNTGKEIRINNLLDELKKHETIQSCFSKLSVAKLVETFGTLPNAVKCKVLEPGFVDRKTEEWKQNVSTLIYSWLDPLKQTIQKHLATLRKIRKIDKVVYGSKVRAFYLEFDNLLQDFVKSQMTNNLRIISYVYLYTRIHSYVVQPFFWEFLSPSEEYPRFFTAVIVALYDGYLKTATRTAFKNNLDVFKKIGMLTLPVVTNLVDKLIYFNVQITENQDEHHPELLSMLTELEGLGVDLSRFLRSLLIQRYTTKTFKERELIQKQFFFTNFGEVYLEKYVSNLWSLKYGRSTTSLLNAVYVDGLTLEDIHSDEYALELFYIQYENRNKKLRLNP